MRVFDLLSKFTNVKIDDEVEIIFKVRDIATNECEYITKIYKECLCILKTNSLNEFEVDYFNYDNNKLSITVTVYKHF